MEFPLPEFTAILHSEHPLEGIVSIYGDFGVGKTTLALQISLIKALKNEKIVYIYTKPNFPSQKIEALLSEDSLEVLDEIIFLECTGFKDLVDLVFNLEFLVLSNLEKHEEMLNFIVIDSLTELYRIELNSEKKETNLNLNYKLNQIMANLFFINETYGIEILVVNEVSKKEEEGVFFDEQSGGSVMDYWTAYPIRISRNNTLNKRTISLDLKEKEETLEYVATLKDTGFF